VETYNVGPSPDKNGEGSPMQLTGAWILVAAATSLAPQVGQKTTTAYVDVAGGGRLYYEECGSGPNLVLLHDGLLHSVVWDDVWSPLCARYHVLRYDRRGYGRSDAAKAPFSPEGDLLALMQHVHMDRATLVGSSSGTALALDFAIAHPAQVEALVLIGPVVHGMRSSDYFLARGNAASAPLANGDVRSAADNWAHDPFQVSGARPEARKKILDALVSSPQNFSVPGQFEIRPVPPTVTRLGEVSAPTLVLVGDGDIADVHAFAGAIQAAVPVVRREVWKGVGHLIELEDPQQVVKRLDSFVAVARRQTITVARSTLEKYAGTYQVGNSPATIALQADRLVFRLNGDADVMLFAASPSRFFVRTTGTSVEFELDESGVARALLIANPNAPAVRCPRIG
jgi:pimeloyl-ACP methyl ester carboxylesterase